MNRFCVYIFFGISMLLLLGCIGAPQPIASNGSQQPSGDSQTTAPISSVAWKEYQNIGLSFEYPEGMSVQESLSSYYGGAGYATVVLQSKNSSDSSLILIAYTNLSNQNLQEDPKVIASGILSGDNTGTDPLGALHQATGKSQIATFDTQNGYGAAEMAFKLKAANATTEFSGYALELYNPVLKAGVAVRIMSLNSTLSKEMRDRFVSSFKFG